MKKIIIIFGCILLGCYMFTMILSNDSSSFKNMLKEVYNHELEVYSPDK